MKSQEAQLQDQESQSAADAAAFQEDGPGKGKKAKKEKAPKLDADGNPIVKAPKEPKAPKLDADGNPIPKREPIKLDDTNVIIFSEAVKTGGNPKRPNTNAHAMFELYRDGMTVKEYVEAGGGRDWVRWDVSKGHITLG